MDTRSPIERMIDAACGVKAGSAPCAGSGASVGRPETPEQTAYYDHVAYCKRCKISGGKGRETIRHCATGERMETAAFLSAIGGKRQNK